MVNRRQRKAPKSEIVFAEFSSSRHWDKVRIEGRIYALVPHESGKAELEEWETNPAHARACCKLYEAYRRRPCPKPVPAFRRRHYVTILANALHVRLLHAVCAGGVLLQIVDPRAAEEVILTRQLADITRAASSRDIQAFRRAVEAIAKRVGIAIGPTDIAALGGFTRQALGARRRGAAPGRPSPKSKVARVKSRRPKTQSKKPEPAQISLSLPFGDS